MMYLFDNTTQLNKPIPDDLVSILAKDEQKQKQIREKASKDASSVSARTIGVNSVLNPTPGNPPRNVVTQPVTGKGASKPTAPAVASKPAAAKTTAGTKPSSDPKATGKGGINMVIQPIPPFKGKITRSPKAAPSASGASHTSGSSSSTPQVDAVPTSPTAAARLNVNASSFRPNPKANAFSPVTILGSSFPRSHTN